MAPFALSEGSGTEQEASKAAIQSSGAKSKDNEPVPYDFEHEEAYMDIPDALRSRQFVHRAILSTIIRDTARVQLGSFYLDQSLGFNAIYQPADRGGKSFAKFASGVLGLSAGYVTESGHSAEAGIDLSGVTNLVFGYRYLFTSQVSTFWPFIGVGLAMEFSKLRLSDIPVEAQVYQGSTTAEFLSLGAIIPLVDLAVRAEAKFVFYGLDRLMLNTTLGILFYL